ncbi:MAG: diaminopimelate epimerase [Parabacteroides sp.]|nr:diaminopimelate epimerase [Parabacteroides sp.]
MTQSIRFTKMQGAGNDYIYINTILYPIKNPEKLSQRLSAPHTGIGSDGLVLIGKSEKADFSMRIFNADGSEAMMCGNASRCIGKYVYEKNLTKKKTVTLETLSGIKELLLSTTGNTVTKVTVDMGKPIIGEKAKTIDIGDRTYTGTIVSMGNPHFVIYTDDISAIPLSEVGPLIEKNIYFPNRTNVEFVQVLSDNRVRMRVWERGSGITQACGTGACATAVASIIHEKTARNVEVVMDGGPLSIQWNGEDNNVFMTGDAVIVFEGEIDI